MPIQREIVGPQHGGTITSHAAGITQGTLEFAVGQAHDIQSMFARMGAGQMEFDVEETTQILQTIEQSQYDQIAYLEDMTLNAFSVDRTDDTYQSYRSGTSTCLAVGSLAVGGYGVAKAGYQAMRYARAASNISWSQLFRRSFFGKRTPKNQLGHVFPENPNDLLSHLPRDRRGHIYPTENVRIRPEKHALDVGEIYNPRHNGQHYHVEVRTNPTKSWKNENYVSKIKPEGYTTRSGTGFLPGEQIPKY